jgi:hypothetical protein
MATVKKITSGYIEFLLLNGRKPHSVFELTKKLKMEETEFYAHFPNLDKIPQSIPLTALKETMTRLENDAQYDTFSSREKILSLFYTLFEELKENRSYYLFSYNSFT